ncbi:hypothetical protein DFH94DRAFT_632238 [Russula ochroleuca]|uniref:RING-type domain-containing protein n=1 Tax=Russula ochroleuca TaxID=152965 RepID=A0A9P5MUY6_9AGAM|nr:hypothetical protein DFH94DRAFT_632238 [Russula ochroleuca]
MASPPPSTFHHSLGPWSFFASGYAISLFAMALLLNRIQNIVVPGRRPPQHHARSSPNLRSRWVLLRLVLPSVLPIDLSTTYPRVVLRLPSMYLILKSLLLWSILLLQAADCFPPSPWKPLRLLDEWAAHKEMDEICWSTFLAICGALCIGALTKGLEGVGTTSASPFNLFGYSFMLHFYSSPLTHLVKPEGLPSRPDLNVIFTIYVPLFQLAMIHFIGAKQSWSNQRLIPTTICSVLTLAHFHWVLWFSPSSYPLLNYVSCVFESLLVLVIILAFSLNILTQLLLEGSITRLFIGHTTSLMPKWDEDFSIVLFRLGIASLDATSVAGLGNEVSCIALTDHAETPKHQVQYGEAEMNRFGVSSITHATEYHGGRHTRMDGFSNEIRRVRVSSPSHGDSMVDATWFNEFRRFGFASVRFGIGVWRMVGRLLRGHPVFSRPPVASSGQTQDLGAQSLVVYHQGETKPSTPDRDIYERFLSGEALSDDDDDDFSPPKSPITQHDDDDDDDVGDTSDEEVDTLVLFRDLSAASTSSTSAPVLLAHMTDTSSSPLTRRRYRSLVSGQEDPERSAWETFVNSRRAANRPGPAVNERNCVICITEERQIICWPCRCLALCDDCRQNLASRHSASKHTCPCCRQQVEGFSRIYIP